ncbi:MAG: matrixin family metalloprotease, partial [Dermatophilaceae bacterium]
MLTAASAPATPVGPEAALTSGQLASAVSAAKAEWIAAYPSADFTGLSFQVRDLPGLTLGTEQSGAISIDVDAAGWGWGSGGMSLNTAVRHELGHVLGLGHSTSGLMSPTLAAGQSYPVDASSLPKPVPAPAPSPSTSSAPAPAPTATSDPAPTAAVATTDTGTPAPTATSDSAPTTDAATPATTDTGTPAPT